MKTTDIESLEQAAFDKANAMADAIDQLPTSQKRVKWLAYLLSLLHLDSLHNLAYVLYQIARQEDDEEAGWKGESCPDCGLMVTATGSSHMCADDTASVRLRR